MVLYNVKFFWGVFLYAKLEKTVTTFMLSQTVSLLGSMLVMYTIMWYVTLSTQSGVMMTIMVLCNLFQH